VRCRFGYVPRLSRAVMVDGSEVMRLGRVGMTRVPGCQVLPMCSAA
jgi:hypothetical protein